jgi:tRNA (cmo5U34)-methyltransferase
VNTSSKEWSDPKKPCSYLKSAESESHRKWGEKVLLENIPEKTTRILDIGSGDGRLIKLIKENDPKRSDIEFVALDISPTMMERLKNNFANDPSVKVIEHDLEKTVPNLGYFDAIISSFTIHHLKHSRKYTLYEEIYDMLNPLGVFCNLEHVASVSTRQHIKFFKLIEEPLYQEEKTDRPMSVEKQLQILRDIGFVEVDCLWKWYELALLFGYKN